MKIAVLISSAGRRNKLLGCFREAGERLGVEVAVFATDMNPQLSAACHHADRAFAVPRCTDAAFGEVVRALCAEHHIGLLIPTIDTELAFYADNAAWFKANHTHLNISASPTIALARDKLKFHEFLTAHHLPTPQTGEAISLRETPLEIAADTQIIFKPRDGSRSIGIVRVGAADAIPPHVISENYIWQTCWRGREFTVNFFVERDGRCRCVVPYERLEVRDGEISKGITRRMPALEAAVRQMAENLPGAYGAMCAQAIVCEDGQFVLFELNARFGGGHPLADNAGAHFAQWLIEDATGQPSSANNNWTENRTMLRFDDAVFC
jgi:carbamoyl-phosphate synthase large subunit